MYTFFVKLHTGLPKRSHVFFCTRSYPNVVICFECTPAYPNVVTCFEPLRLFGSRIPHTVNNVHYCGWTHLEVFGGLPPSGVSRSTAGRPSTRRAATRSTGCRGHPSAKQASTLAGSQTKLLLTNRVLSKDAVLLQICCYVCMFRTKYCSDCSPTANLVPGGHSGVTASPADMFRVPAAVVAIRGTEVS